MNIEDVADLPIVKTKPVCPCGGYVMASQGAATYHVWICYSCRKIFSKAPGGGWKGYFERSRKVWESLQRPTKR